MRDKYNALHKAAMIWLLDINYICNKGDRGDFELRGAAIGGASPIGEYYMLHMVSRGWDVQIHLIKCTCIDCLKFIIT